MLKHKRIAFEVDFFMMIYFSLYQQKKTQSYFSLMRQQGLTYLNHLFHL